MSQKNKSLDEIARAAANKAMRGGLTGAAAQVVNVLTLMGLRTTMNYQMAKVGWLILCRDMLQLTMLHLRVYGHATRTGWVIDLASGTRCGEGQTLWTQSCCTCPSAVPLSRAFEQLR